MKAETKTELDSLFKKNSTVPQERRRDPRSADFDNHLSHLQEFTTLQDRVIRPMMVKFGRYLESLGHRYFIGSFQDLVEGRLYPSGKITMHILLNSNFDPRAVTPSFSFREQA